MKPCIAGAIAGGITAVVLLDVATKGDLHRGILSSATGLFKNDDVCCGGCCGGTDCGDSCEPAEQPETQSEPSMQPEQTESPLDSIIQDRIS